ncbi:predicted protein [Sclerotinia sclerotiorum 1980 UF-70]|uniref:Uncharacterized protein n=1 Tax=Sclerotinia sclerotiorum (strain ATCC 18683 / 1980 / Ss-1) TaxID=665079 RepID=A7ESA9_SCLS1|nr:predicted protein [Sclerotinia sclerotiorum 1980 UF-70]EDN92351.1 predicted protein [Sclerotinia sclerotiorum 1980 UF-70]
MSHLQDAWGVLIWLATGMPKTPVESSRPNTDRFDNK